jgi:hypothetical protein
MSGVQGVRAHSRGHHEGAIVVEVVSGLGWLVPAGVVVVGRILGMLKGGKS